MRSRAAVARRPHKAKVGGSNPSSAPIVVKFFLKVSNCETAALTSAPSGSAP